MRKLLHMTTCKVRHAIRSTIDITQKANLFYILYLLVKGKLTVIFEKNPSGGYRTKGMERDGVMTRVVPGGRAKRPSEVTHNIRF